MTKKSSGQNPFGSRTITKVTGRFLSIQYQGARVEADDPLAFGVDRSSVSGRSCAARPALSPASRAVRPPTAGEEERPGKGKECPVGPSEPGTWRKPFPELELMAEHDDLVVLLEPAETMNPKKLGSATDQTVEKPEGHDRRGSSHPSVPDQAGVRVCASHTAGRPPTPSPC